jgi:Immunity protein 53
VKEIIKMSALQEIQHWYFSQCNENWEHAYGVSITTLDNPGWCVTIDLTDTELADKPFTVQSYDLNSDISHNSDNWIDCKVENNKFIAYGGSMKLEEMLNVFLLWAKSYA